MHSMRQVLQSALVFGLIALGSAVSSRAAVVTLTFEGLQDTEGVANYYNGGTGSMGSGPGPNYGVTFGSNSLALSSTNPLANFADNPSPTNILFFLQGSGAVMNVAAGFDAGLSFYYCTPRSPGVVTIYDDVNATGHVLATLNLPVTPPIEPTDKLYNNWQAVGVAFVGIAKSVNFSGTVNKIGLDNITLGSDTPMVPEPSSIVLAGLGCLGGLAYRARRRRV
jgi:hypothetical protein